MTQKQRFVHKDSFAVNFQSYCSWWLLPGLRWKRLSNVFLLSIYSTTRAPRWCHPPCFSIRNLTIIISRDDHPSFASCQTLWLTVSYCLSWVKKPHLKHVIDGDTPEIGYSSKFFYQNVPVLTSNPETRKGQDCRLVPSVGQGLQSLRHETVRHRIFHALQHASCLRHQCTGCFRNLCKTCCVLHSPPVCANAATASSFNAARSTLCCKLLWSGRRWRPPNHRAVCRAWSLKAMSLDVKFCLLQSSSCLRVFKRLFCVLSGFHRSWKFYFFVLSKVFPICCVFVSKAFGFITASLALAGSNTSMSLASEGSPMVSSCSCRPALDDAAVWSYLVSSVSCSLHLSLLWSSDFMIDCNMMLMLISRLSRLSTLSLCLSILLYFSIIWPGCLCLLLESSSHIDLLRLVS